jgi:hypothetical protein
VTVDKYTRAWEAGLVLEADDVRRQAPRCGEKLEICTRAW